MRIAEIERNTKETKIKCKLNLDGEGKINIETKIGFFNHMINTFAKHAGFDLDFYCDGDTSVDMHHTVEDSGIVLGQALYKALGTRENILRYQSFTMAMDDALVMCAVDISNRSYYESNAKFERDLVGEFETQCVDEFFKSFSDNAKINLHFVVLRGENAHHIIEAMFKSLAKCIKDSIKIDPNLKGSLTTKGVL